MKTSTSLINCAFQQIHTICNLCFERRTDKRYRCKFPRVTTYNVIDIISHHQCVSIVPHRVRMEAQPERLTHFGIVYGRMCSHIQQVSKVKHIAQFGKFACDITNIFIAGITAKLRSNDKIRAFGSIVLSLQTILPILPKNVSALSCGHSALTSLTLPNGCPKTNKSLLPSAMIYA